MASCTLIIFFFFFNDTATTEIYTLSLHDALPIYVVGLDVAVHDPALVRVREGPGDLDEDLADFGRGERAARGERSEEHTSELQSLAYLVCRLLLEKKKNKRMSR